MYISLIDCIFLHFVSEKHNMRQVSLKDQFWVLIYCCNERITSLKADIVFGIKVKYLCTPCSVSPNACLKS